MQYVKDIMSTIVELPNKKVKFVCDKASHTWTGQKRADHLPGRYIDSNHEAID